MRAITGTQQSILGTLLAYVGTLSNPVGTLLSCSALAYRALIAYVMSYLTPMPRARTRYNVQRARTAYSVRLYLGRGNTLPCSLASASGTLQRDSGAS